MKIPGNLPKIILTNVLLTLLFITPACKDSGDKEKVVTYPDGISADALGRLIITQYDVSWLFDGNYTYGKFANGDYWVVGPATVIGINPPCRASSRREKNGSMVNPSPKNGVKQGFDSFCEGNDYSPALNVARNVSSTNPLVLQPGSSLVSGASYTDRIRAQLRTVAVLTVLNEAPADPQKSFRPPYCGNDKTIRYSTDQLHYDLLENLDHVEDTPDLAEVERYFERPWIDHLPGWGCRSIHPAENMPDYGREIASQVSTGALMLHLKFTDKEKETLLIRYVQLGIDLYGIVQDGGSWACDGGHASGRKWPILFAGLMLDDEGMKKIGQHSGDYLYTGGNVAGKLPVPAGYINFGEDDQTFYVSTSDVTLAHYYLPDRLDYPEYSTDDIGLAEWGIRHATAPDWDGKNWDANYRTCCTAISWPGFVLAARIMGANTPELWNHPALFDYMDRYVRITSTETDEDGDPVWWRIGGFVGNMWDANRDDYGSVYSD